MKGQIIEKGMNEAVQLGTQKVIGYSKRTRKTSKSGKITETSESIGIQAWEIGVAAAGIGAYEFLTGKNISSFLGTINPLNPNTQATVALDTGIADINPQPVTSALTRLFESLGVMRI